ncbi:MAG: SDR family NAD(P)-dependent oxidoreductase [Candidatus Poribacteria bacterium]|nr:SDR family NAD(P)-dependent oxidoreductase [Candidatus Poribacteria bacterium]MDP6748703.1 SDR family NAD(P)-dependent oxidoreductase [Candidatus Poribacteria bacterium]MDP6996892.1 SDR family NAD(P)-dependent oxidoreductase [Candidatus Poribacteria bacterium]
MKVELQGKVALVTGAARGIGKAIANKLAQNGATVIFADINHPLVQQTAGQADQQFESNCQPLQMDVRDPEQVEQGIQHILTDFGHLDILINNAGINTLAHRVNIDQFPLAEWQQILDVDLTGLFTVSQYASRPMIAQQQGRIVNIASVAGLVPLRLQCAFTAAKAGVVNLTKAMAIELGSNGVLVNGVAPGSVLTEGTRKLFYSDDAKFRQSMQSLLDHIPLGRPAETEEIAHAVLFLVAPESSYINGHVLVVDGGWTAGYLREF